MTGGASAAPSVGAGLAGVWAGQRPAARAKMRTATAALIVRIVGRQNDPQLEHSPISSYFQEIDFIEEEEFGELLERLQKTLQNGIGTHKSEGHGDLPDSLLFQADIVVPVRAGADPGLGKSFIQVEAELTSLLTPMVEGFFLEVLDILISLLPLRPLGFAFRQLSLGLGGGLLSSL